MLGNQQIHFITEMVHFKKMVVFLVLIPTNIECKSISNQVQSNRYRRVKRVVGGVNSNDHEFPWMAAVVYVYHSVKHPDIEG